MFKQRIHKGEDISVFFNQILFDKRFLFLVNEVKFCYFCVT